MILADYVPKQENTYKEFKQFIFNILGQNQEKYRKFGTYPQIFQVPFYIQFLESKNVPILDAIQYYGYLYIGTSTYQDLVSYMIVCEFKRIEEKKETNYIPF